MVDPRKQARKEQRLAKKRKPLRKSSSTEETVQLASSGSSLSKRHRDGSLKTILKERQKIAAKPRLDPSIQAQIDQEEMEIARLGKLLGMSGSKDSKKMTSKLNKEYELYEGFGAGFADFLDECDVIGKRDKGAAMSDEEDYEEEDMMGGHVIDDSEQEAEDSDLEYDEEEEEEDQAAGSEESEQEQEEGESDSGAEVDSGDDEEGNGGSEEDEEEEEEEDSGASDAGGGEVYQPVKGEDIYGRPIGQTQEVSSKKYVPPAKRARMESAVAEATEDATAVRRQVNGCMNKLSEQSRDSVVRTLKGVFESNSHTVTSNIVKECVMASCGNPTQTMVSLIPTYASVIAALHFVVGIDVGAHIVENLAITLHKSIKQETNATALIGDKLPHNCLLLLMYLYNLRILSHKLIFDIMNLFIGVDQVDKPLSEVDAELLVQIFSHCGSQLRSDDPVQLRSSFQVLTAKVKSGKDSGNSNSRIKFMMEALTDLKNNKSKKGKNDSEEELKKLRRWLGGIKTSLGTKGTGDNVLRVSLDDLLNAESRGRWWKAGASWAGVQNEESSTDKKGTKDKVEDQFSHLQDEEQKKLLSIAARLKFNTSTRKNIFLVMMSSRDVNDAFERLTRLELKGKQDREIVRVLTECCSQEKTYNAFYSELASLLCAHNRQFKTTIQFSFWDTFKAFGDDFSDRRAINLARMLAHLVCTFQLPLSIIKPLDMGDLSETTILFLATFFMALFSSDVTDDTFQSIFDRVATTKDYSVVREAVLLFLQRYFTAPPKGISGEKALLMEKRRKQAIKTMEKMSVLDYRGEAEEE